ncbi:MAG: ATP phosphoribosyltransferase regulatory subunit, partial [Lachnospiraceae bacterium]|nr:ATP phosphoribosyltransferase regulatory subunit [Lachnospiraceae bacterium]
MARELTHTPEGVRDLYGEALERQTAAEERIGATFAEFGYERIRTPALEYFDLCAGEMETVSANDLYKYADRNGATMVLRPDFTPSIARCAVKYFLENDEPLRLCYQGSVFNNKRSLQGKLKEETQMGAELYNDASVKADAEIIAMSIKALLSAGITDIRVCIGHVEYFYGICEAAGIDDELENELIRCIGDKNLYGTEKLLREREIPEPYRGELLKAADLFFEDGDLKTLGQTVSNDRSKAAIARLQSICE